MDWYELEATDTLFFRDGRPFSAGEDAWANSLFPPAPGVAYGVLRSIFFGHNMDKFRHVDDIKLDGSLKIKLRHMLLSVSGKGACFPLPADLLRNNKSGDIQPLILEDKPKGLVASYNDGLEGMLLAPFKEKSDDLFGKALLDADQFQRYLDGDKVERIVELDEYLSTEAKVGLARSFETRHAEDGMLYKVRYRRPFGAIKEFDKSKFKQLHFLFGFEGQALPAKGVTKFGGDGKLSSFQKLQKGIELPKHPEFKTNETCKMYLATPAVFVEGWQPRKFFTDHGFQLLTAAIPKGRPMGGWDMTKNGGGPKPMRKTVPAGSVYFLKVLDEAKANACIQAFHGKAIEGLNHVPDNMDQQGYGVVFFGKNQSSNSPEKQ